LLYEVQLSGGIDVSREFGLAIFLVASLRLECDVPGRGTDVAAPAFAVFFPLSFLSLIAALAGFAGSTHGGPMPSRRFGFEDLGGGKKKKKNKETARRWVS